MNKIKPYVGPSASGFIWGTLAFILQAFLTTPSNYPLEAFQELAIWSTAGAVIGFAIAFIGDQFVSG